MITISDVRVAQAEYQMLRRVGVSPDELTDYADEVRSFVLARLTGARRTPAVMLRVSCAAADALVLVQRAQRDGVTETREVRDDDYDDVRAVMNAADDLAHARWPKTSWNAPMLGACALWRARRQGR